MSKPVRRSEGGQLADNIVFFARTLRRAGLPVGPASVIDAIRAVEVAGVDTRADFYWTLHAIFVKRREHHAVFDEAFRIFWRSRQFLEKMLAMFLQSVDAPSSEKPKAAAQRVAEALFDEKAAPQRPLREQVEITARLTVSAEEKLQQRDFAQMTAAEIVEAERQIARLQLPDDSVATRRLVAARPPGGIDPRRTLRASLRTGGGMIPLRYRRPRMIHPPIVVLCDISGSMSQYTRIFLHFMHALADRRRRVHCFLFGTRLTNITRQIRRRDPDEALAACSGAVLDWSGGTRIATALHEFNRKWSRRVLGQGAIVLLFTDGLERDGEEDLAAEMDRLHRSCRRLIWLNPLLRFGGFEAKARGIRAMLPRVDEFRSIHSLEAIADLCRALDRDGKAGADPRAWLAAAA
ncbi:MAG: VWA domain-containing protein [Bauldia sp.]